MFAWRSLRLRSSLRLRIDIPRRKIPTLRGSPPVCRGCRSAVDHPCAAEKSCLLPTTPLHPLKRPNSPIHTCYPTPAIAPTAWSPLTPAARVCVNQTIAFCTLLKRRHSCAAPQLARGTDCHRCKLLLPPPPSFWTKGHIPTLPQRLTKLLLSYVPLTPCESLECPTLL